MNDRRNTKASANPQTTEEDMAEIIANCVPADYVFSLPFIRRLQNKGMPDHEIEDVLGMKLLSQDRRPENDTIVPSPQ